MLKHHNLISFIFGLGFLILMQIFAEPSPNFRFMIPAFVVYAIVFILYNRWYLKQIQSFNIWTIAQSALLLFAAFGLSFNLPSAFLRGIFLTSAVAVITFYEILLGSRSESVLLNETLLIAFGIFFYFSAAYHYVPGYETFYLAGVFFASFLLARSFYEFMAQPVKTKIVGSAAIGLFMCEAYWALNFLPFHFSVLSILLFNFFYFFLLLNYYHTFHILNFKKLQFHFVFIIVTSSLALLATPWRIVS